MATTATLRRWLCTFAPAVLLPGALVAACADDATNPIPVVPAYVAPDSGPDSGTPAHSSDSGGSTLDGASGGGEDAPSTPKDGAPVED